MRRFRVLVVEDDPEMLKQIRELLRSALPASVIEGATSVKEAHDKIDAALQSANLYDLGIIDFRLPKNDGEFDEVDESVCRRLVASMPQTIVSHITGFPQDERIPKHLTAVHPRARRWWSLLEKGESFGERLVEQTRESLYGSWIENQVEELLPSNEEPHPDGGGARYTAPRRAGSVSNRLMDLCLDIGSLWSELGPRTKELVLEHFEVEERPGRVSVLPK